MQSRWKRIGFFLIGLLAFIAVAAYGLLDHYKTDLYDGAIALQQEGAGMQPHRIQVAGFDWSYLENDLRGQKPTMVMVHGFGAFKENWLELATELKDDFHLVLVDLPGFGASSFDPAQPYDIYTQTQRLHAFLAALGVEKFHIVGNSMGGAIAALYAGNYPDALLSVTLLDPAGVRAVQSDYEKLLQQGKNPLILNDPSEFDFLVDFAMEKKRFAPWPLSEVSIQKMVDRKDRNQIIFAQVMQHDEVRFKQAITQITAPTLIAWGKQDRVIAAGNATEFQRLIPRSQVALLDGVGHVPMMEIPVECAALIRNFTHTSQLPQS